MLYYLCNAFNDPSDPWYYVIGLLFLLLIFGAIAAYIILSGKKNKDKADRPKDTDVTVRNEEESAADADKATDDHPAEE